MRRLDVAVVAAGPAGIGMALALQKIPGLKFGVLEAAPHPVVMDIGAAGGQHPR